MERDLTLVINVTGREGDQLDLLVENMGRVNFGPKINDYKVKKNVTVFGTLPIKYSEVDGDFE